MALCLTLSAETTIHLTSWHSVDKDEGEWNTKNYGLSYKFDNNIKIGAYNNSSSKLTTYVGYEHDFTPNFGIVVAACTGYKVPVCATLYAKYKHIRIDLMPIFGNVGNYGAAFGLSMYI